MAVQPYRIFINAKDIQTLESCCTRTAITRLNKIKKEYNSKLVSIRNYCEFNRLNEPYIIEQMQLFKLI
jgi:hypothetical protein